MIYSKIIGALSAIFAVYYFITDNACEATYFLVLAIGMLIIIKDEK